MQNTNMHEINVLITKREKKLNNKNPSTVTVYHGVVCWRCGSLVSCIFLLLFFVMFFLLCFTAITSFYIKLPYRPKGAKNYFHRTTIEMIVVAGCNCNNYLLPTFLYFKLHALRFTPLSCCLFFIGSYSSILFHTSDLIKVKSQNVGHQCL